MSMTDYNTTSREAAEAAAVRTVVHSENYRGQLIELTEVTTPAHTGATWVYSVTGEVMGGQPVAAHTYTRLTVDGHGVQNVALPTLRKNIDQEIENAELKPQLVKVARQTRDASELIPAGQLAVGDIAYAYVLQSWRRGVVAKVARTGTPTIVVLVQSSDRIWRRAEKNALVDPQAAPAPAPAVVDEAPAVAEAVQVETVAPEADGGHQVTEDVRRRDTAAGRGTGSIYRVDASCTCGQSASFHMGDDSINFLRAATAWGYSHQAAPVQVAEAVAAGEYVDLQVNYRLLLHPDAYLRSDIVNVRMPHPDAQFSSQQTATVIHRSIIGTLAARHLVGTGAIQVQDWVVCGLAVCSECSQPGSDQYPLVDGAHAPCTWSAANSTQAS